VAAEPTAARWALVTGASGGIGAEFARLAAADGYHLALVARSAAPLAALAAELGARHGVEALPIVLDLARRGAIEALLQPLAARAIVPELLINNAGVGLYGLHAETPLADELALIELNVVALVELTKRLLPALLARGRGRILNVASTAAFQPGPYMSVYYASKAFVLSYSEALAYELRGSGISVTALCPGPTVSGFQAGARMRRALVIMGGLIPLGEPRAVARAGYQGLLAGRGVVIPGLVNRLLVASLRLTPRRLATASVAFVSRPR
jgi:uncharacterized protein